MRSATLWRDKFSLLLGLTKSNKSQTPDGVCPETAYLGLVRNESKRSARSGHPCRILLVYCTNAEGLVVPMESELADKAISVLSVSVRDTDYIGWYRQGHIVGVLLTTLQRDSVVDGCQTLQARLADRLCDALTFTDAHSLQIHVLNPGELTTFNPSGHSPSSPVLKD
ncbi:MAG: hypothetical protein KF747_03610 [Nitrospira sp.]|nr:hypothetical protein [Nitrospira sp.]